MDEQEKKLETFAHSLRQCTFKMLKIGIYILKSNVEGMKEKFSDYSTEEFMEHISPLKKPGNTLIIRFKENKTTLKCKFDCEGKCSVVHIFFDGKECQ